jgi:hypothetical protein
VDAETVIKALLGRKLLEGSYENYILVLRFEGDLELRIADEPWQQGLQIRLK